MEEQEIILFRNRLINWFKKNKRDLPWRTARTAWATLLSEVMLQQTRVDQVLPYFERFINAFPTIQSFAEADRDAVLLLWEGLGYYSRARNLHEAAKYITAHFDGKIPSDYQTLLTIKGIGPYTAAAICSQFFNQKMATVDGNIIRVLSRIFGIREDVRMISTQKQIQEIATLLIDENEPGTFNEALMELGATVCKPQNPDCATCPVAAFCQAYHTLQTEQIPYKSPKKKIPHHQIGIGVVFNSKGQILIAKRPDEKMLGGLWEFPGGKQEKGESLEETVIREFEEEISIKIRLEKPYPPIKHSYSHFKITLNAFLGKIISGEPQALASQEIKWVWPYELKNFAFPTANRKLIDFILADFP